MTSEKDIVYENGDYWVFDDRKAKHYVVFKNVGTHSVSDSAYERNDDEKSIAVARCDYLASRLWDASKTISR